MTNPRLEEVMDARQAKQHWSQANTRASWISWTRVPVTLESEDSGWTSEPVDKVVEQRDKLARSIKRTGELARLMEEENVNIRIARQELESLTFSDPESKVSYWNHNECWKILISVPQVVEGGPGLGPPNVDGAWGGVGISHNGHETESDSGLELLEGMGPSGGAPAAGAGGEHAWA